MKTFEEFNSKYLNLIYTIQHTKERIEELKEEIDELRECDDYADSACAIYENEQRIQEYEDSLVEFEELLTAECLAVLSDEDVVKKYKDFARQYGQVQEVSEITGSYRIAVRPIWIEDNIYGRYVKRYDNGDDGDVNALWTLAGYAIDENCIDDVEMFAGAEFVLEYDVEDVETDILIECVREVLREIEM